MLKGTVRNIVRLRFLLRSKTPMYIPLRDACYIHKHGAIMA